MEEKKEELKEDLKKYFDPKEYITKIVGKDEEEEEPTVVDEDKVGTLIKLLTDTSNRDIREQALLTLKKEKGEELLLVAIASPKGKENRHKLVAACWESEINFSRYLPFFILLALDEDYLTSLEAITVISTMEGPFDKAQVEAGIIKVKAAKQTIASERVVLLNDLVITLEDFIRE